MPPKKKRRGDHSGGEWKVQKGRRFRRDKNDSNTSHNEQKGAGYKDLVKESELFEKYYQGQGFISMEEWPDFMASMRESLPATFRITGTRRLADQVLRCLEKTFFVELAGLEVDGEKVPPPFPLPWYPNNLAWSVPLTKKFIRKSPLVSKFHTFLVRHSDQGNISRQEAVSMIPPLLLDVRPHHKVLDMCAAPGSKTAQLIELLHAEDSSSSPIPRGVVVANDADNKRCYMLVHQAKRLNSACLMVTNHDASVFPMLYYHDASDKRLPVFYDRVLCDVPCSGDGTLRKNCTIWHTWNPLLGTALHKLQLRILHRGLELLTPGGRLVYSTCSLNPVENEAVVNTALELSKGAVKLVEGRHLLPGLKTLCGRTSWKLMTKEGSVWLESYADIPKSLHKHFSPSMFPPTREEAELEKCIRVLPHHQDTGGFFIAVMEKLSWLPWQSKAKTAAAVPTPVPPAVVDTPPTSGDNVPMGTDGIGEEEMKGSGDEEKGDAGERQDGDSSSGGAGADDNQENSRGEDRSQATEPPPASEDSGRPSAAILGKPDFKRKSARGFKEDPYVFFKKDSDFFDNIKSYYGFPDDFPLQQFLTRTKTGKKKNIYFCSDTVRELTLRNENSVKLINIGVKVMARCESKASCNFRLAQEGVESLLPYIHNHQVEVRLGDLLMLLKEANPLITSLSPQTQDQLQTLDVGPIVFAYDPQNATSSESTEESVVPDEPADSKDNVGVAVTCPLHLSGWLAARSVRLFLDKSHRYIFLSMLAQDPSSISEDICLDTMNSTRRKALQNEQEVGEDVTTTADDLDEGAEGDGYRDNGFHGDDKAKEEKGKDSEMEVDGDGGAALMDEDGATKEDHDPESNVAAEEDCAGVEDGGTNRTCLERQATSECAPRTES